MEPRIKLRRRFRSTVTKILRYRFVPFRLWESKRLVVWLTPPSTSVSQWPQLETWTCRTLVFVARPTSTPIHVLRRPVKGSSCVHRSSQMTTRDFLKTTQVWSNTPTKHYSGQSGPNHLTNSYVWDVVWFRTELVNDRPTLVVEYPRRGWCAKIFLQFTQLYTLRLTVDRVSRIYLFPTIDKKTVVLDRFHTWKSQ